MQPSMRAKNSPTDRMRKRIRHHRNFGTNLASKQALRPRRSGTAFQARRHACFGSPRRHQRHPRRTEQVPHLRAAALGDLALLEHGPRLQSRRRTQGRRRRTDYARTRPKHGMAPQEHRGRQAGRHSAACRRKEGVYELYPLKSVFSVTAFCKMRRAYWSLSHFYLI